VFEAVYQFPSVFALDVMRSVSVFP
jgi:hypothetical protein